MNKLICIVGLPGAGKSEVADYLRSRREYGFLRFGQIVLDKVLEITKTPTEALEKKVREELRREHGMAAMALLNIPKFDQLLQKGDAIGDGLYSWEEYLILKDKYNESLVVLAVYAPPEIRYQRLESRAERHKGDKGARFRSFTREEALARDKAQIENLNQAGPISMADYLIKNTTTLDNLKKQVDEISKMIYGK